MKSAQKRAYKNSRPKHKQTKEYLSHYYPFLPLLASIGFLLLAIFTPFSKQPSSVLGVSSSITQFNLLEVSNQERSKSDAKPLTTNSHLNAAAQTKADDMVKRNYWSHQTPEGNDPWVFITNQNYAYQKAGENLAYGFDNATQVVDGWMNSATHRANLLDKDFLEVGFGIANSSNYNQTGPETVVVAMYARPQSSFASVTQNSLTHVLGSADTVSRLDLLTQSAWASWIVAALGGASITYLVLVNGRRLRRAFAKTEKFVIRHPLLESLAISMVALSVLLLRATGSIL